MRHAAAPMHNLPPVTRDIGLESMPTGVYMPSPGSTAPTHMRPAPDFRLYVHNAPPKVINKTRDVFDPTPGSETGYGMAMAAQAKRDMERWYFKNGMHHWQKPDKRPFCHIAKAAFDSIVDGPKTRAQIAKVLGVKTLKVDQHLTFLRRYNFITRSKTDADKVWTYSRGEDNAATSAQAASS